MQVFTKSSPLRAGPRTHHMAVVRREGEPVRWIFLGGNVVLQRDEPRIPADESDAVVERVMAYRLMLFSEWSDRWKDEREPVPV